MAGSRGNERKCLSDLPDEILLHIISFLPAKSLVATSLLSRRWRYLWTFTPTLCLDEFEFVEREQFLNFAERALLLHVGSLVSFSLHLRRRWGEDDADYESRINALITSAIQYNVEQLHLYLQRSFILPVCLFECQSLVKLDLGFGFDSIIRVPMVSLPRLKHLTLRVIEFEDNESAEKLLSHPLLEELVLCNCKWYNVTSVSVNSPKLLSLTIYDDSDYWPGEADTDDEDDWSEEQQICFFGDNLKCFRYGGRLPPTHYCICGSTMQLMEAEILVCMSDHEVQEIDGPSNRYCKLINSLSMVQNLTLSYHAVESLYRLSQCPLLRTTLPVFERLTRLNLDASYKDILTIDGLTLKMLYKSCPHLEHLNFKAMIQLYCQRSKKPPILRPLPACFRTHLKKVTLQSYEPERKYQDPIFLLFNSARVLEEVVIHWKRGRRRVIGFSGKVSTVEELERELNSRPKVSKNCKVSIVLV